LRSGSTQGGRVNSTWKSRTVDYSGAGLPGLFTRVCCLLFVEREFCDMKLDELNKLEDEIDEEDERIFEAYRLCSINCLYDTST